MKLKRTGKSMVLALLAGLLLLLPWFLGTAFASLTPAGTTITNRATATFTDANNNVYAPVNSNIVTVTVSQVASVTLTPATSNMNGSPGGTTNFALQIVNSGNGADTFTWSAAGLPAGYSHVIYRDTNGDGILQPAEAVPGNVLGANVALGAGHTQRAIAVITAPAGAAAGSTATLNFTATSTFNPAVTATAQMTVTIQAAVVNFTKTASPANPRPGDTITYTVSWVNSGTAPAYLTVITDPIPANTTYRAGTITFNGAIRTDAADGDNADFNVSNLGQVTVTLGTVPAGGTGNITFQVTVNTGIASATVISNTASGSYQTNEFDPATRTTVNTNPVGSTVAQVAGLRILPPTMTTPELPGNLNLHPFTITNTGNGNDTFSIASVGLFWTWNVFNDVNQDGLFTANIDTPVTDTNADGVRDTGVMTPGMTKHYIAFVTVTGVNGQQGRHTITATSLLDPAVTGTSIKFTDIRTPVITLVKSVSPGGPQPPGTVLTYTINVTNSGAAPAQNFVLTDVLSPFLDFVPGSITVAGTIQTDAADADFGRFDSASGAIIVTIPSISAGVTVPVVFRATIR